MSNANHNYPIINPTHLFFQILFIIYQTTVTFFHNDRDKLTIDPPLEKLFSYKNNSNKPSVRYRDNELLLLKTRPRFTEISIQNHSISNGHSPSISNRHNTTISHNQHLHNHTHPHPHPHTHTSILSSESSEKSGFIIPSRPVLYTVLSKGIGSRSIYQGIIATPPHNPLFLRLIQVIDNNHYPIIIRFSFD